MLAQALNLAQADVAIGYVKVVNRSEHVLQRRALGADHDVDTRGLPPCMCFERRLQPEHPDRAREAKRAERNGERELPGPITQKAADQAQHGAGPARHGCERARGSPSVRMRWRTGFAGHCPMSCCVNASS